MVKKLVCGCGCEGSIPFNDILNLVLIDDKIINVTHVNITHNSFGHNLTPRHVVLLKQVVRHDSNDHSPLIQYDYKSSCKHSCFF